MNPTPPFRIFWPILLFFLAYNCRAQSLSWIKQIGGLNSDISYSITCDNNGNVIITGYFGGTVDFDPNLNSFYLTSVDAVDSYILKLDSLGNFLWAKGFVGLDFEFGHSVTTDLIDNVISIGEFGLTSDFDPGPNTYYLSSLGNTDIYIVKLDPYGNFKWAKQFGGIGMDDASSITSDAFGNIYAVGTFFYSAFFDQGTSNISLTSFGGSDVFISKMDSTGNLLWVKQLGGVNSDGVSSVTVDTVGSVIITGHFQGIADFDPGPNIYNLSAAGGAFLYLSKIDSSGNFLWAKNFGNGSNFGIPYSITTDLVGSIYITGYFSGSADFDPGPSIFNLNSVGSSDIFLLKLDASGNFVWAKNWGGPLGGNSYSLATDNSGNIYITGSFSGEVDFDPSIGISSLISYGNVDAFISKFDTTGNFLWVKQFGGTNYDYGRSIKPFDSEDIYLTGYFRGNADFDPGLDSLFVTSNGDDDIFVLKLKNCSNTSGMIFPIACDNYVSPSGKYSWSTSGYFLDTIPNFSGCDSIINIYLTIINVDVSVTISTQFLIANAIGATFQWLDCTNNFSTILGDTNQIFTVFTSGSYAVEVTQNGCVDTSICNQMTIVNSIAPNRGNTISIFPNPSKEILNIELGKIYKEVDLVVKNVLGQIVMLKSFENSSHFRISIPCQPGIYFVEIITSDFVEVIKVLLE